MKRFAATALVPLALFTPGCGDGDDHDFIVVNRFAADLDDDGFADLVIGAPRDDGEGVSGSNRGAVFIHLGGPDGPDPDPSLSIFGAEDGAEFGSALAFVGDVNGQGAPDLLVGAPLDDGDDNDDQDGDDRGRAFIFFGGPSMDDIPDVTMTGAEIDAQFGTSVGRIADTNLDGFDDWVVGAPFDDGDGNATNSGADRGRAFLFLGGAPTNASADLTFTGAEDDAQFGAAVDSAGDLNDGAAEDIAVGAPFDDADDNSSDSGADRGRVFVFFGGSTIDTLPDLTLSSDENDASFGTAVALALDVDGDGIDDLLVGAPFHDAGGTDRGRAYVFFGAPTPSTAPGLTISGTENGGAFGAAVSRTGDVSRDGRDDFFVGAPLENPNGRADAGSAYLYFGGPGVDEDFDLAFDGVETGARFGAAVAGPGDFDGGDRDVIVGAPRDDADGDNS